MGTEGTTVEVEVCAQANPCTMKSESLEAPDVSIHITTKNKCDTKDTEKQAERTSFKSKNRKRKRVSASDVGSQKVTDVPTIRKDEGPERTTSFRHLFSFAGNRNSAIRQGKTADEKQQAGPFAFFGSGSDLDDHQEKGCISPVEDVLVPEVTGIIPDDAKAIVRDSEEHQWELEAVGFGNDAMDVKYVQEDGNEQNANYGSSADAGLERDGQTIKDRDHIQTPVISDLDMSPDGILAMARNFCRKQTIEELEAEWSASDGIREQMKRDFKLKRRNSLRDRKLGNTSYKG